MEVERVPLVHFVEIMISEPFRRKFSMLELEGNTFLQWIITIDALAAKSMFEVMKKDVDTCIKPSKKTMFARSPDPSLKYIWTEEVWQTFWASLCIGTYGQKDKRERQFFFRLLKDGNCLVTFLNGGHYMQRILNPPARKLSSPWTINSTSTFEALVFLHASLVNTGIVSKMLSCVCTYINGMQNGYTAQNIKMAWLGFRRPRDCDWHPRRFDLTPCSVAINTRLR